MSPLENPTTWIPYGNNNNNNDCSQGICNMFCPQWCNYIIHPPPPHFEYPDDDSNPNFSPLVIAIIGILVTIFLLITYYTIISKYCGHRESSSSNPSNPSVELQEENQNHVSSLTNGLDENLINSIAVYKYNKKRDFFVGNGIFDCSVCLSEFQDGECVRLLPKCNHGFHLPCIDTWLKSQSTCPLCRSSIFTFNASNSVVQPPLQPQVIELELPSLENVGGGGGGGENEFGEVQEGNIDDDLIVKGSLRAFSDLNGRERVIEIRDEYIRSMSLDHHHHHVNEVEDSSMDIGSSKRLRGESSKSSYKRRVLHCVMSPIAMKRSFSSGRFSFSKIDRGKQGIMLV